MGAFLVDLDLSCYAKGGDFSGVVTLLLRLRPAAVLDKAYGERTRCLMEALISPAVRTEAGG